MSDIFSITDTDKSDTSTKIVLNSPIALPKAGSFLWNKQMLLNVNCRGYVSSQFMQPEPSKYSYSPNIEAKTFIQPEHSFFAHHPGRFIYIKDEITGEVFSLPHEPMRVKHDKFNFIVQSSEISWEIENLGLLIIITVSLAKEDVVERWSLSVKNLRKKMRKLSIYPYFSIGYMSWMNQSASFNKKLNGIVASSITPYQKVDEYFKNTELKEKTFFIADKVPCAWHCNQHEFEGEGGLHNPDALKSVSLNNTKAHYQSPVAVLQYRKILDSEAEINYQFLFGPAKNEAEISDIKLRYMGKDNNLKRQQEYDEYIAQAKSCLTVSSEDSAFDSFINHWLPRQMFYHGDVNRLTTDPQTRNFIQDNMAMCFINPKVAREAFILALSQQAESGVMPDGILLHEEAELKYINQVPHADHSVWLPICLASYLNETGDVELLAEQIPFAGTGNSQSFLAHIELSLESLLKATDHRGLSYIEQGDWCDPMNMVGYKGRGVSGWLSLATAYSLNTWCDLSEQFGFNTNHKKLTYFRTAATAINQAVNEHLWHGKWFARGITDEGRVFGTAKDDEGKIFLNAQTWAILSGAANKEQQSSIVDEVAKQLETPYGVMMLAPSYTKMVEDIGRITQKHPGVSENGSVYNHAAIFYIYALYQINQNDLAYSLLSKMLPSLKNSEKTGQLPVYLPNYYRGAYYQIPEETGRSSHLFNTGTVAWVYRCLVEEFCGLKGGPLGLMVQPKLPSHITKLTGQRRFRESIIDFEINQCNDVLGITLLLDNQVVVGNVLKNLQPQCRYKLVVSVPANE